MVISNLNSNVIRTLYVTIPKICSLILTDLAVDGLEMVIIDGRVDVAFPAEVVEGVIHLLLAHLAIQLLCNLIAMEALVALAEVDDLEDGDRRADGRVRIASLARTDRLDRALEVAASRVLAVVAGGGGHREVVFSLSLEQ